MYLNALGACVLLSKEILTCQKEMINGCANSLSKLKRNTDTEAKEENIKVFKVDCASSLHTWKKTSDVAVMAILAKKIGRKFGLKMA